MYLFLKRHFFNEYKSLVLSKYLKVEKYIERVFYWKSEHLITFDPNKITKFHRIHTCDDFPNLVKFA